MRAVVQRVRRASVRIAEEVVGQINLGYLVLLGVARTDQPSDVDWLVDKLIGLRIMADAEGKMNRSLSEVGGSMLVVSQFTLYGDCQKGRRPTFIAAAPPSLAVPLYERLIEQLRAKGVTVATGQFGADMQVELVNDGPVTLILDSPSRSTPVTATECVDVRAADS